MNSGGGPKQTATFFKICDTTDSTKVTVTVRTPEGKDFQDVDGASIAKNKSYATTNIKLNKKGRIQVLIKIGNSTRTLTPNIN